jgi:hypothetical protein
MTSYRIYSLSIDVLAEFLQIEETELLASNKTSAHVIFHRVSLLVLDKESVEVNVWSYHGRALTESLTVLRQARF